VYIAFLPSGPTAGEKSPAASIDVKAVRRIVLYNRSAFNPLKVDSGSGGVIDVCGADPGMIITS
jgi:hypothetical protein